MHQAAWYKDNIIPHNWSIGVSNNGWTTNKIGLVWLKLFYAHTRDCTFGTHWLLVLDGHGSHISPEFDRFCIDHNCYGLGSQHHIEQWQTAETVSNSTTARPTPGLIHLNPSQTVSYLRSYHLEALWPPSCSLQYINSITLPPSLPRP